jgi:hypothetical protein
MTQEARQGESQSTAPPNLLWVTDGEGNRLFSVTAPLGTYGVQTVQRGVETLVRGPALVMEGVARW